MKIPAQVIFAALLAWFSVVDDADAQTQPQIQEAQSKLKQIGLNPGPIDGVWGDRTEAALARFLHAQDMTFDGTLSDNELSLLRNIERLANTSYTSNSRPISHEVRLDGTVIFPRPELPQYLSPPPNDETLAHYFSRWLGESQTPRYRVEGSANPRPLRISARSSSFLERQLETGSVLSYLYYDGEQIIYDAHAPSDRFEPSFTVNNELMFRSNSVGKSFVAYLYGHAICAGYIDSIYSDFSDWKLLDGTLYSTTPAVDLLNMRGRDQHLVTEDEGFISSGRWFNGQTIETFASNELQGSTPNSEQIYNYHGYATNILLNYIIYKTGNQWDSFLQNIIQNHIGFERDFLLQGSQNPNTLGPGWYSFFATRYDYMRFAIAVLEDWQNETCVGQYLRDVHAERQPKGHNFNDPGRMTDVAKSYGGQMHFDFTGMQDRTLFGMNGQGNQTILIDMDTGQIVTANTAHTNYNWRRLVYDVIRFGSLPD